MNYFYVEEGKYLKVSLGDDRPGFHLVTFHLVKGLNNSVCGTNMVNLLL